MALLSQNPDWWQWVQLDQSVAWVVAGAVVVVAVVAGTWAVPYSGTWAVT